MEFLAMSALPFMRRGPLRSRVRQLVAGNTGPGTVQLDNRSLLERRGWVRQGKVLSGPYLTSRGSFAGLIEFRGDRINIWIKNPPQEIKHHWHSACLSAERGGWHRLHLSVQPRDQDLNAVVQYVERFLRESFELARKLP
jgi:hypothetical protein